MGLTPIFMLITYPQGKFKILDLRFMVYFLHFRTSYMLKLYYGDLFF